MIVAETGIGAPDLLADPEVLDELVAIRAEQARAKEQAATQKKLRAQLKAYGR